MNGLLGNPMFMAGMGLLASNGPSRTPVNPWRGAMTGLLASSQVRAQQERMELERAEMEQMRQYREAEIRQMLEQQSQWKQGHELDLRKQTFLESGGGSKTADWKDYERAREQGYPGSFMDWKLALAEAQNPYRDINNKPLGTDAQYYANARGESPPASMSVQDAEANGYQLMSLDQRKGIEREATIKADLRELKKRVGDSSTAYEKAKQAFSSNPSTATRINLDNAASALQTAIAGLENWRGEPSEGVAGRFEVPGAWNTEINKIIDSAWSLLGGKPDATNTIGGGIVTPQWTGPNRDAPLSERIKNYLPSR